MSEQTGEQQLIGQSIRPLAMVVVFALGGMLTGHLIRTPAILSVNDGSRWDTVWSLVERGTYIIDEAPWQTIDKVKREGHFYSSKPALLPTIVAGEYWLVKKAFGWKLPERADSVVHLTLFLINILPLCLMVWLYAGFLDRYVADYWWRAFWLVAAAFGTYLTSYTITFNNHSIAAASAFFALWAVWQIVQRWGGAGEVGEAERGECWWHYALAGFFSAFCVCNEQPSGLFALALFGYLLSRRPKATLLWFVPAAAVPTVAFFVTQYLSTGGFLPVYLYRHTELYHYEGSYWNEPKGIDAISEPKHIYLFHMLFGHHGVFSLTPLFLFSLVSVILYFRGYIRELGLLHWLAAVLTVLIAAFYVKTTNNYGGMCNGFRWMFWLIPLWLLVAPLGVKQYGDDRGARFLALVCLAVSVVSMAYAFRQPWSRPWLHQWLFTLKLISY